MVIGLLEPEQAAPPDCGLDTTADTPHGIDPRTRQVHLDSGATRTCDALIIASGSRPPILDEGVLGRDQAIPASLSGALEVQAGGQVQRLHR